MPNIDLFIAGAQKAGTTSVKNYLGEHPQIITHEAQEFPFFFDDAEFGLGFETIFNNYFEGFADTRLKIVCKHAHLYTSETAIKRLSEHNPNCKLIFIIRNPVDRTFSSYLMEKLYNRVNFEFDDIILALNGSGKLFLEKWQFDALISFGFYSVHLNNILKYFPRENVRLILFEDFKKHPLNYIRKIFSDFGINEDFQPRVRVIHNQSSAPRSVLFGDLIKRTIIEENNFKRMVKKIIPVKTAFKIGSQIREINKTKPKNEKMSLQAREFLNNYFKPYNEELKKMTNLDLSCWEIPGS